jgi:hypothetical protein
MICTCYGSLKGLHGLVGHDLYCYGSLESNRDAAKASAVFFQER